MILATLLALATTPAAIAPAPPPKVMTPSEKIAIQKAMMAKLPNLDGVFVGNSTAFTPAGPVTGQVVHRIGPFLDGSIKVMEGRNYSDEGNLRFNGMIVLYYDVPTAKYRLRGFANGGASETDVVITPGGYYFDAPIEGTRDFRRINITATPDSWSELVEIHSRGKAPTKGFEMKLRKISASNWPVIMPRPAER